MKKTLVVAGYILAAALVGAGCQRSAATSSAPPAVETSISVVMVRKSTLQKTIEVPASVEGYEHSQLAPRIAGLVESVLVDIGQEVKQGDVLATLAAPELADEVARRKELAEEARFMIKSRAAEVEQAQSRIVEQEAVLTLRISEYDRTKNLVAAGALKQEKLDEAQFARAAAEAAVSRCEADIRTAQAHRDSATAAFNVAGAEVRKSETMASFRSIRAPFDGVIASRNVNPGDLVDPDSADDAPGMFEIVHVDRLRVVLYAPMEDAVDLSAGDPAVLHSLPARPGVKIDCQITRRAKAFGRNTRMMRAEIDLGNILDPETQRRPLLPGDYGKVTIALRRFEDIPSVPSTAIYTKGDDQYVMVVLADNTLALRNVEIAVSENGLAGISSGLEGGETIVADDPGGLQHGQSVSRGDLKLQDY